MIEPPKVFAIVSRDDYAQLRRLIPALPTEFCCWMERRYRERHAYESCCSRYAELEVVCPVAFGRDCVTEGRAASEAELDAWAARRHGCQMAQPAGRPAESPRV